MKVVLEGTEEQIKNLKSLIEYGDNDLPVIKTEYQVENLWSIADVQSMFYCTEDEAMEVLEQALTAEHVMERIWDSIYATGISEGLTERSEDISKKHISRPEKSQN